MSDDAQPADTEAKTRSYPQKYWWLILVLLPVALALIKLVPDFVSKKKEGGGAYSNQQTGSNNVAINGSANILNSDLSTKTYVINMAAIEKEYAVIKHEPLQDDELKREIETALALLEANKPGESAAAFEAINRKISLPSLQTDLGVAYQKAGDAKSSNQAFVEALEQDPNYAPAHHNLGLLKVSRGELVEAQTHFEKSSAIGDSKVLASAIQQELKEHDYELEPNNEPSQANVLPLEKAVAGNIPDEQDTDFFLITTPAKYRDILQVKIENQSTTLRPGLRIFDGNKAGLSGNHNETPGANLEHTFPVPPDSRFFVQVYGDYRTTGRYTLTVKPLKKYDAFEPNGDILHAAHIDIGKEISGDIMDSDDTDFYHFKTNAEGTAVKVHIENQSTTLRPGIRIFDSNKSALSANHNETPGANLEHSFPVKPNTTYFADVYGDYSTSGSYTLTLTEE